MEQRIVTQRIKKIYPSPIEVGIRYYAVISALNNLGLTERETQILAFTANRGTIGSYSARESFCQLFGSTKASLGNMMGRLIKRGLLVRIENRVQVHPVLAINFDGPIILHISISS